MLARFGPRHASASVPAAWTKVSSRPYRLRSRHSDGARLKLADTAAMSRRRALKIAWIGGAAFCLSVWGIAVWIVAAIASFSVEAVN